MDEELKRRRKSLFNRINNLDAASYGSIMAVTWGRMSSRMTEDDIKAIEATTRVYEGGR